MNLYIIFCVTGASERQHIATHCYSAETEDFATAESSKLDTWVFDHVEVRYAVLYFCRKFINFY